MAPLDSKEIVSAKGFGAKFFRPSQLEPGQSVVVEVVDINKNMETKYPLLGKDYCYRAILSDGGVWDINSVPVAGKVIQILYPDGASFQKGKIKITKKTSHRMKETPYEVEKA